MRAALKWDAALLLMFANVVHHTVRALGRRAEPLVVLKERTVQSLRSMKALLKLMAAAIVAVAALVLRMTEARFMMTKMITALLQGEVNHLRSA